MLVVHPSVPVQDLKELISLAKARPGQLNYATASAGSPAHLAAELFSKQKMASLGVEPFVASPDEFAARMKADMAKYAEVIKKRNIKLD